MSSPLPRATSHATSRLSSLLTPRSTNPTQSISTSRAPDSLDVWILGSGIASLTAAVYLIRKTKVPPPRVHIIEALSKAGAGSASRGNADTGYHYGAACIPPVCDSQMEELLSLVPSEIPGKTVWEDILEYFEENIPKQESRTVFLARKKNRLEQIEGRRPNLGLKDRIDLFILSLKTESALGRSRIRDHFPEGFFRTNYWLMLATMFGFRPSHSAAEFRRFIQHFPHDMQTLNHPHPLHYVRFNFHESIIKPVARFLQKEGVDFIFETITTDITAEPAQDPKRVTALHTVHQDESERTIDLGPYDIVIASMGSVFSGSSRGSNTEPPSLERMEIEKDLDENWLLWLELSTKHPKFGNAYNFCTRLHESRVGYFTVTLKNPSIFDRSIEIVGGDARAGSLVILKDSSWLLTLSLPRQPVFPDQPDGVRVFWGYAIYPENEGDFVKKSMLSCSGEEIMTEVLHQLDIPVEETLPQSITIPCVMPRMTAALLCRNYSDRPKVVPQGMTNMALIGQFVDIPREIVTIDYMVRGAQIAVHQLMGLERQLNKSRRGSAARKPGSG